MNCPKCNAAMENVAFEGVNVDRCTSCKGIFFDANENKALKEKKGAESIDTGDAATGKKMDKITNIKCPRCHASMIRMTDVDQHHIDYEACTVCYGVFLDAGEFKDWKNYTVSDYLKGLFTHKKKK